MNAILKPLTALLLPVCILSLAAFNKPSNHKTEKIPMTDSTSHSTLPPATGFEKMIDGKQSSLFILKNKNGAEAAIANYGGHLVGLMVPDKNGKLTDVVIGFDDIDGYKKALGSYFGATVGRYGNRIAKGHFVLEGTAYTLATNNFPNSLHGGKKGFNDVVWDAKQINGQTLELTYLSKDMEEGFPGNLNVKVTYELTDDNAVKISYMATTDKTTVVNLTNHSYFNLNGIGSGTILNHVIEIKATHYTPVDATAIPTGEIAPVAGTPFDFTHPTTLGSKIDEHDEQLKRGHGYDHNFVLDKHRLKTPIATVTADKSGIVMQVFTEEPGVQLYTGNFMGGRNTIIGGKTDEKRTAFCLETQHYPDSPNQPQFPSTVLKSGETYKTVTIYKFSVK
jgi:aldose 1-epimerase